MWRAQVVLVLAVGLTLVGCSAQRPDRADPVTSASPSAAKSPVTAYNVKDDDIAKLGLPLQPVPAGQKPVLGIDFKFQMTRVGTTTRFTQEQLKLLGSERTEPLSAPAAVEYLVVVAEPFALSKLSNKVEAVFHVGDRAVAQSVSGTVLVVDAPIGGPVVLDVTWNGRTQKMDLRTGQGSNLVEGYPVPKDGVLIQCQFKITEPGVKLTGEPTNIAGLDLRLTAFVLPWDTEKGWPADGRRWLMIRREVRLGALDSALGATTDLGADLTVTGPGGRLPITGEANSAGSGVSGTDTRSGSEYLFEVAVGPVSLAVTYKFRGTVSYAGKPARYSLLGGSSGSWCGKTVQLNL
jgi:hypothetical protein